MTLALVDGNENVADLHPVLVDRLEALAADPRLEGRLAIESGARTRAEQTFLRSQWDKRVPGYNYAAHPDADQGVRYGVRGRGSWHMVQSSGYAYAADVSTARLGPRLTAVMHQIAPEYLLQFPVAGEDWHVQMVWADWWTTFTDKQQGDEMTPEQDRMLREIHGQWQHHGSRLDALEDRIPVIDALGALVESIKSTLSKAEAILLNQQKIMRKLGFASDEIEDDV